MDNWQKAIAKTIRSNFLNKRPMNKSKKMQRSMKNCWQTLSTKTRKSNKKNWKSKQKWVYLNRRPKIFGSQIYLFLSSCQDLKDEEICMSSIPKTFKVRPTGELKLFWTNCKNSDPMRLKGWWWNMVTLFLGDCQPLEFNYSKYRLMRNSKEHSKDQHLEEI